MRIRQDIRPMTVITADLVCRGFERCVRFRLKGVYHVSYGV